MDKKLNSHILLAGTVLVHLLLVILSPITFYRSVDTIEPNILYNIAIDVVLVFFILSLVSKSWKIIVPYVVLYEVATIIGLGPLNEAGNFTIGYDILSILVNCGVIALVREILKDHISKLNIKIIGIMTIIAAISNSFIAPGFGAPNSNFLFQIIAILVMTVAAWLISKLKGQALSLKDTGNAFLVMAILPLIKRFALFLVLGLIGINTGDFSERVNLIYGVDLIISILISYLLVEPLLKSTPQSQFSPSMNRAVNSINAAANLSSSSNNNFNATTLQILQQVQALQSPNVQERSAAVLALSEIDDPRVPEILKDVYETSPDMFSRMLAMNALEKRGIKLPTAPASMQEEISTQETENQTNQTKTLDDYVRQLIELRKGNNATSFFLGENQPGNLMGIGEEIADKFGSRGLEYVTQKIRTELKSTHPYDGRELESAWDDIWAQQKMKEESNQQY